MQGVGYRAWTASTARDLGVTGWVRNRRDGAVEVVAQGKAPVVDEFLARCRRGPADARVDRLEIVGEGGGAFASFAILPTA